MDEPTRPLTHVRVADPEGPDRSVLGISADGALFVNGTPGGRAEAHRHWEFLARQLTRRLSTRRVT